MNKSTMRKPGTVKYDSGLVGEKYKLSAFAMFDGISDDLLGSDVRLSGLCGFLYAGAGYSYEVVLPDGTNHWVKGQSIR